MIAVSELLFTSFLGYGTVFRFRFQFSKLFFAISVLFSISQHKQRHTRSPHSPSRLPTTMTKTGRPARVLRRVLRPWRQDRVRMETVAHRHRSYLERRRRPLAFQMPDMRRNVDLRSRIHCVIAMLSRSNMDASNTYILGSTADFSHEDPRRQRSGGGDRELRRRDNHQANKGGRCQISLYKRKS